jgi:serine/threonine protein kinase
VIASPFVRASKLQGGSTLGKWKLGKFIAGGGQGEVWEVRPSSRARTPPRALKVCYLSDPQSRSRFEQEVRLLSALPANSLIVPVLDSELGWKPESKSGLECSFYVTERFDCSVATLPWLHKTSSFAIRIFRELCEAVEFLHTLPSPVIHRDIKPSNVLLASEPYRVVLGDLGIALNPDEPSDITKTPEVVGSEFYRAPETLLGKEADARSDVYSLGRTLEWMLTGKVPNELTPHDIPASAELGPAAHALLSTVIRTACAADPASRFQTVSQLKTALPNLQLEIAGAQRSAPPQHSKPQFSDGGDAYARGKLILAARDLPAWREVEKRQRMDVQRTMMEWRSRHDEHNVPRDRESMAMATDDMLQSLAIFIAPAIASIELGQKDMLNPLQILRDVTDIAGWNNGGTTLLAEAPRSAAFLVHHLLGAMAVMVDDIDLVATLASVSLTNPTGGEETLLRSHDLVAWPGLLGGDARVAWDYLKSLPARAAWLDEVFASSFDYVVSLTAYRWQLSFIEYAATPLAAGEKEDTEYAHFDVPPVMLNEGMESVRRGFRRAFRDREHVDRMCRQTRIAASSARNGWDAWLGRMVTLARRQRDWRPWYDRELDFLRLP